MAFTAPRLPRLACVLSAACILSLGVDPPAHANDEATATGWHVDGAATVDLLDNTQGGLKTGTRAMYNLDLTAAWQGAHGWEAFGYILVDGNGGFSSASSGDAQVVSNIDASPGTRLFEAWGRKTSDDRTSVTTFGIINLNGIFDTQPNASVFMNASNGIGPDYSQSGPPIFPVTGLGLVHEWRPTEGLRLRAGLFDGLPGDPGHGSAFTSLHLSADEGAHYVVEAEQNFDGGFVKLGRWGYTVREKRIDGNGTAVRQGAYGQLGLDLTHESDAEQGLKSWIRAGVAEDAVFAIGDYLGGGLSYTGLLPGRGHDVAGIAVMRAGFGASYRDAEGAMADETTMEMTYQAEIRPGLIVQPDIQYIVHPSGDPSLRDALMIGVRLRIGLSAFSRN